MCVSHLFQIACLICHICVKYAMLMLALILPAYESGMKHENHPQEGTAVESENQTTGTKAGNNIGFDLSQTSFRNGRHDFKQDINIKTRNKCISSRQMHARRHFYRMKRYIFLKKINCLWARKTKTKPTHVIRSNSSFPHMNSFVSYHLHRSENYSSSSESDDDLEQRTEEELAGVNPDIVNMGQFHEASIAGGVPIQCMEDILDRCPILEESQVHPGYQFVLSSPETNGRQMNGSYNGHILDSPYIDLHPEIPVGGIQVHYDPQNAEFSEQAANAFRECQERIKESKQTNCTRRCSGIDHDLIYQEFLRDPDKNSIRDPIQASGDNSTSGIAAEVNLPGTELEHAPCISELEHAPTSNHSPNDEGIGTSGAKQSNQIHVQDGEQCATGATSSDTIPIVLQHTCVFCGKRQVSIRFQPCQHAISCQQCSVSKRKCSACGKVIDQKILM